MSVVILPNTLAGVVVAADIQENEQALADVINGQLDNSNIVSGANVSIDKLDAQYEWLVVPLMLRGAITPAGYYDFVPMYQDSKGNWTVSAVLWLTTDVGAKTGVFAVEYGYYDAAGAWQIVSTTADTTLTGTGADGTGFQGSCTLSTLTALVLNATPRSLALRVKTAEASTTNLHVSVVLKRKITAA